MIPTSQQRLSTRSRTPAAPLAAIGATLVTLLLLAVIGVPVSASSSSLALTPGTGTAGTAPATRALTSSAGNASPALTPGTGTAGTAPATRALTSTGAISATSVLPAAAQTGGPAAVQTGGPAAVQTGGPPAVQTGGPAGVAAGSATTPGTSGPAGASDAPWLPWLVGAIILAGLAGLAAFALRQRNNPPAAPVAGVATALLPILAEPAAAPVVTQIRCPNCDALNPADRRFCDECGQDLRPAALAATAAPVPPVDETTTPYLETLSRVDEQLEFVLARNTVKIGRALDNDIVIDDQFIGWQTVSPHHARLIRQPEGFMIEDLNAENGTFVNSARTGQNLLEDGMTLALGQVEFIYRVPRA